MTRSGLSGDGAAAVGTFIAAVDAGYVFGCPGTTELSLVEVVSRGPARYMFVLHDTVAVGMADGFARARRRLGVANLHASQGLLNAAGFIRVALRDEVPLLVVAGLPSSTYDFHEPNHLHPALATAVRAVTKWVAFIREPGAVSNVLVRAAVIAQTPPFGPVVVGITQDALEGRSPTVRSTTRPMPKVERASVQSGPILSAAADALSRAQRPVVFAGHGARDAAAEVERVARCLGAPVISESLDRGPQIQHVYCRTESDVFIGYHDIRDRSLHEILAGADALLFIGPKAAYPRIVGEFPDVSTVIHVSDDPGAIGKDFASDVALVGPIPECLRALEAAICETVSGRGLSVVLETRLAHTAALAASRRRVRSDRLAAVGMTAGQITPFHAVRGLSDALPKGCVLVDDSQSMGYYIKHYLSSIEPGCLFGSLASHLGWGLPAALGAKLALPGKVVVCVLGDTSLCYSLSALATAGQHQIAVLIVVANNGGSASLKQEMAVKGELSAAVSGILSFTSARLDLAGIASSVGVEGHRVEHATDVTEVLRAGLATVASGRPCLIDLAMSRAREDWEEAWYVPERTGGDGHQ